MEIMKENSPFKLSEDQIKRMKHSKSMKDNLFKKLNHEFRKNKNEIINNNKTTRLFIARKIDSNNIVLRNFCRKGIKELFNNKNLYFSEKYNNNTIKIGNGEKKLIIPEPKMNIERKNFIKRKTMNLLYLRSLSNNRTKTLYRNPQKNILDDSNNNTSFLGRYDYRRASMNKSSLTKKTSIIFKDKGNISDRELKIYFQNIKRKINEKNKSRNEKYNYLINNRNNSDNKSISNEIKNRLFLQEKILNEFKTYNINNNNIIKRLKKLTKKNKENLLINQIDNYPEKINKISEKIKPGENHLKAIEWFSSLRQYNNNIKNMSSEKKDEQMLTYSNDTKKEQIFENYINKLHYSFGKNSSLYSDIQSRIRPLCALIIPRNLKNKETTKISYFHENNKKNTLPIVVGKSLLDYEIELSKDLEGKKKIFVKKSYPEEDIKPLTFAKSNNRETIKIPKAVTNTLYLHFNK